MENEIRDINGDVIDPLWAAEFRGFFFGEGYLGIIKNGTKKRGGSHSYYRQRVQITLRDDDRQILEEIQKRLGGYFGQDKHYAEWHPESKPTVTWRVSAKGDVERVLSLLEGGWMPAKKRQMVELMRAFLVTVCRIQPGPRTPRKELEYQSVWQLQEELYTKGLELHAYAA